jgi:hypothetical protein
MAKTILKALRRVEGLFRPDQSQFGRNWHMFPNKSYASKLIVDALNSGEPTMIARLGSTEMLCMTTYLGVNQPDEHKSVASYIRNQSPPWWWSESTLSQIKNWSGFFPPTVEKVEEFCELMIGELPQVDILGSWLKEEAFFQQELRNANKVMLEDMEPFFSEIPWTKALAGKKVLVVHPFSETIQRQYLKRKDLFDNELLPDFELDVIQAVQSIAAQETPFDDWFQALDYMKEEISKKEFDICILGCGAYGFPLASFVKSMGRQAIHLGGATQLLFGIKGARWENYIVYPYANLFNDHWVRPGDEEKPKNASIVEGACYW